MYIILCILYAYLYDTIIVFGMFGVGTLFALKWSTPHAYDLCYLINAFSLMLKPDINFNLKLQQIYACQFEFFLFKIYLFVRFHTLHSLPLFYSILLYLYACCHEFNSLYANSLYKPYFIVKVRVNDFHFIYQIT